LTGFDGCRTNECGDSDEGVGDVFFHDRLFLFGTNIQQNIKTPNQYYVGKYDRIRSGADGLLYFFPSPYKGAE
jgi:hypothetical protein